MEVNRGPLARSEDLIVEELGDEVLIYDSRADKAHCLSADAALVWRRCDGKTPSRGLVAQTGLTVERVESALDELARCELLEEQVGQTRRELGVKVVKAGAAVAATPLIVSVLAPTPAMAVTPQFCFRRSSGNCGTQTGCTSDVGCCCCSPPIKPPYDPGSPCDTFGGGGASGECKTCVPCDQDDQLCPQFGGGTPRRTHRDCSAGDKC